MQDPTDRPPSASLLGRSFVGPWFDYFVIGGGLSLLATAVIWMQPVGSRGADSVALQYLLLFSNSAHFAASTVRLYTKPGAVQGQWHLARTLPWAAVVLMSLCVMLAGTAGRLAETIYLAWSPYHYSAQAYGLAVVYSYRSGTRLEPGDKRLLWWASMFPFFYMAVFILGTRVLTPLGAFGPSVSGPLSTLRTILLVLGVAAPVMLFLRMFRSAGGPMPLISLLTLVSNAIWFFVLDPLDAFIWATVFHGLQYLAIVLIFDVRDQLARPGNRRGWLFHAGAFYAMSLVLGYALFILLPAVYGMLGFDYYDSRMVSIAFVNIHHFIVDAYIWRLGPADGNRRIVQEGA